MSLVELHINNVPFSSSSNYKSVLLLLTYGQNESVPHIVSKVIRWLEAWTQVAAQPTAAMLPVE